MKVPKNDEMLKGQDLEAFSRDVRKTADLLWAQAGRPYGESDAYWYRALDQHIHAHNSDRTSIPTVSKVNGVSELSQK